MKLVVSQCSLSVLLLFSITIINVGSVGSSELVLAPQVDSVLRSGSSSSSSSSSISSDDFSLNPRVETAPIDPEINGPKRPLSYWLGANCAGLAAGIMGIVNFLQKLDAKKPKTRVTIKAGLNCPTCDSFGGNVEGVVGYDVYNRKIAEKWTAWNTDDIWDGGIRILTLKYKKYEGAQVDYLSYSNGKDAICVAWVYVDQADGIDSADGLWNGDIGKACGLNTYYSGQTAGYYPNGGRWVPRCAWFDADSTNGINAVGFKFAVQAYGRLTNETVKDNEVLCSQTIMTKKTGDHMEQPIESLDEVLKRKGFSSDDSEAELLVEEGPDGAKDKPVARGEEKEQPSDLHPFIDNVITKSPKNRDEDTDSGSRFRRAEWMAEELIVSQDYQEHRAKELCEDPMSLGPDFIGVDGYFCDMQTRELTPLCESHPINGCLEINHQDKNLVKRRSLGKRDLDVTHKEYLRVEVWDHLAQ